MNFRPVKMNGRTRGRWRLTIFLIPPVRNVPQALYDSLMSKPENKCLWCGSQEELTLDHKLARCFGGSNEESNLQVLCSACNNKKAVLEHRVFEQAMELMEARGRFNCPPPTQNSLADFMPAALRNLMD